MNGTLIEMHINAYLQRLQRGDVELPQNLIDDCSKQINDWFATMAKRSNHGKFTLRMSSIGKPVCQLWHEKHGTKEEVRDSELIPVRFASGALIEAWLLMIIKASGLNVEASSVRVSLDVNGSQISGELDIIIDGVVYDIKSASASSSLRCMEAI